MFRRILLWFIGVLLFSFAGFAITNIWLSRGRSMGDMFLLTVRYQRGELIAAYESGGVPALRSAIHRLADLYHGQHYLLDALGRDLATGRDESALAREAPDQARHPRPSQRMLFKSASPDGRYVFLIDGGYVGGDPLADLAIYGWIVIVIALLCYALAWTLVKPVQQLARTVTRFGSGDLAARVESKRRDEIGHLERSFNQMADRIATLLTAERRLLQDISHELRSPLARLRFALALVPSSPTPDAAIARANKEVDRLATLVGELLQVTRTEGDAQSRNMAPVRLDEFLAGMVEDCRIEAEARGAALHLRIQEPVTWIGDRELLHRAVENVLRNAISHSPRNTAVEVDLKRDDSHVVIRVRDYGTGVPESEVDKIFRPFYRVEQHRSTNSGGVGLGLSIAQRAVAVHHGEIRAVNAHPGLMLEISLAATGGA